MTSLEKINQLRTQILPDTDSDEVLGSMITMAEAMKIMKNEDDYIILDVRRPDEFAAGHIPESVNVPNENISSGEIAELPDKSRLILVYCRSGRRSKEASQKLVKLGYTNVVEFGGILDWPGEIEK